MKSSTKGSILINLLISVTLGTILCGCVIHFVFLNLQLFYKLHTKFHSQQERLIARHYIAKDVCNSKSHLMVCPLDLECLALWPQAIIDLVKQKQIKPESNLLLITNSNNYIAYYLRKSVLYTATTVKYALYRDDIIHNAQALVENVDALQVQLTQLDKFTLSIKARIVFSNSSDIGMQCYANIP